MTRLLILFFVFFPAALFSEQQEATSLLGQPLYRPEMDASTRKDFEEKLIAARTNYEKAPNIENAIWVGRRTAYLGRYKDAIAIYTKEIEKYPQEPRLYRHRGHRFLTIREIDKAIQDFQKAAQLIKGKPDQIEPDGLPNAKNIPTSTLNTNIFYHLGLSYYLKADYVRAENAYRECMKFTKNDDMLVAVTHWLYMTLRKQGKEKEAQGLIAPIQSKMNVIEDFDYQTLCLLYKGENKPEDLLNSDKNKGLSGATVSYGVGNWYLYNGDVEKAMTVFRKILAGKEWASFGYLAAEAELASMEKK